MPRPKLLTDEEAAARRRATFRKAQAKKRTALRASGALEIRLTFTGEQADALRHMREESSVPLEEWARVCFERGAKFVFNAGNRRGGKTRARSTT